MEKKFVSLVIYLRNVSQRIEYFLDTVLPVFAEHFEHYEVICVDDACEDDTIDKLRKYMAERKLQTMVSIVHMGFFQGLESAMNAGRDIAIGDFVYEFDDIFVDYDTKVVSEVYQRLLNGKDIVAASSRGKMRLTSRVFYSLFNQTSRGSGKIGPETFRIVSRRAINRIKSMGQYIPYRKAVYANCGLKMETVFYQSKDVHVRVRNQIIASERTTLALDSFIYFTNGLERVSAVISGVFLLITLGMGVYLILSLFNWSKPVEGWLSTMGFLALGFFGMFTLLTIILKYLSVLLNLIFKQQRYLVAEIEKVTK